MSIVVRLLPDLSTMSASLTASLFVNWASMSTHSFAPLMSTDVVPNVALPLT